MYTCKFVEFNTVLELDDDFHHIGIFSEISEKLNLGSKQKIDLYKTHINIKKLIFFLLMIFFYQR